MFTGEIFQITYLRQAGTDPNTVKNGVGKYSLEDVSLAVNFSSIEFVEQRHHDKSIENNGKMLSGIFGFVASGNVE